MAPEKIGRGKMRSLETPASSTPALPVPIHEFPVPERLPHEGAVVFQIPRFLSHSCTQCKTRKIKCVGSVGGQTCANCNEMGLSCIFLEGKKRGPKPGSLGRTKDQAKHLKKAAQVLVEVLCSLSQRHTHLTDLSNRLFSEDSIFDAVSFSEIEHALATALEGAKRPRPETLEVDSCAPAAACGVSHSNADDVGVDFSQGRGQ